MSMTTLYGLQPPEVKTELKLDEMNREQIIETTYKAWLGIVGGYKDISFNLIEPLYRRACKIIGPFRERLSGSLTEADLSYIAENPGSTSFDRLKTAAGLYLSALLNETNIEELSIGKFPYVLDELGYGLNGKTLEILEEAEVGWVGTRARSGLVVARSRAVSAGYEASGGVFVVSDKIGSVGLGASGGVFVVPGCAGLVGYRVSGGLFMVKRKLEYKFMIGASGTAIGIGPKELKEDADLAEMFDGIELAAKKRDFDDIHVLGRKVDEYVRKNYPINCLIT